MADKVEVEGNADDIGGEITADNPPASVNEVDIDPKETPKNEDKEQNHEALLQEVQQTAEETTMFLQNSHLHHQALDKEGIKYNSGPLQPSGMSLNDINQQLLSLLLHSDDDAGGDHSSCLQLQQLDEVGKLAVVSHSLAAYISTLETKQLRKLATQIVSDTSLWITRLFRFFDSLAYFHNESREGLVKVCRMILHAKYPKFATDGYEALYARPPVIYISAASRPGLGHYLCNQLGLPLSCLMTVPCNTVFGSQYQMDIAALEKMIQEDSNAARIPLIIVANAGTPVVGHVDNLQRLQELAKIHEIWIHVEGHSLAALSLVCISNLSSRIGDSMTLFLGTWFGIPSLPCVTLYKGAEPTLIHAAGLSLNLHGHLSFLPLWVVLQSLGQEGVVQKIHHCFELSDFLLEKLESTPQIKIIGKGRLKSKDGKTYTVADAVGKSLNTTLLFDILAPVVVFQYVPHDRNPDMKITFGTLSNDKTTKSDTEHDSEEEEEVQQPIKNPPYFDNLNSWLGQIISRNVPAVRLDILDMELHGVCIRICPLESAHINNTSKEDVSDFYATLQQQMEILNATVRQKNTFYKLLQDQKNLQLVEISNWAGLGGVRYIPEFWVGRLNELTDSGKEDINRLNNELVLKLKNTDSAFSLGEGDDGMMCVRFGMVTDDLDMDELITLVLTTGQELEESSKFLETMSEMVKQGIEEANKELQQENQERIVQEGLLRHVPIVGTFFNWWSPLVRETGIKGRSFHLTSGVVESTENIYKYHMQIQQGSPQNSPRTPPPVAKTIITPASVQHSRASSHNLHQGTTAHPMGDSHSVTSVNATFSPRQETQNAFSGK